MNRVSNRTWLIGVLLAVLIGGMTFFLMDYSINAGKWVASTGSPHLYSGGNIDLGVIVDRNGKQLLRMEGGRTYSQDWSTRLSTLHWLGDRKGFIKASAVSGYAWAMADYDPINGVYGYNGEGGTETLTISSKVQNVALAALAGRKGTVAVYNYKTGEILCAVTSPTFDPDNVPNIEADTSGQYEGIYLNRFLQSAYTPGSTFKIVTTAAALETVPDILDKTFTCTGRYEYGTEYKDAVTCGAAHGTQNLKGALANSCNCAFAQIAEQVGRKNMTEYVKRYQVTAPVTFDGVSSQAGNYDNSGTGATSFAWSCIGQHTDLINPCRYMTFMGAIAGGGEAAQPHLVAQVTCGEDVTYRAESTNTGRLMPESVALTLQEYMRNNVVRIYGAGNFPGLTVCAKSGTSELGGNQRSNALFCGFVTDEQYPLAFIAVVENGGYGSGTCVPIISQVLAECRRVLDAN